MAVTSIEAQSERWNDISLLFICVFMIKMIKFVFQFIMKT